LRARVEAEGIWNTEGCKAYKEEIEKILRERAGGFERGDWRER